MKNIKELLLINENKQNLSYTEIGMVIKILKSLNHYDFPDKVNVRKAISLERISIGSLDSNE